MHIYIRAFKRISALVDAFVYVKDFGFLHVECHGISRTASRFTFNFHLSSFISHLSSFIFHLPSFIFHLSSSIFIFHFHFLSFRADTLDPALLRPGRLDRKIEFPVPDRRQKRLVFAACTGENYLPCWCIRRLSWNSVENTLDNLACTRSCLLT